MSVVAWDGKILAADRAIVIRDVKMEYCKLFDIGGGAIAGCGNICSFEEMKKWYLSGCNKSKWPECQKDKDTWATLVVAIRGQRLIYYEDSPIALECVGIMAWGSGFEIAVGAMAAGANAITAVEIACKYSANCGQGYDYVQVNS